MAITKKQTNQNLSPRPANVIASSKQQPQFNKSSKPQTQNSKIEEETMPLGIVNYILIAVSLLMIVIGFYLMSGNSNEGATFNNDVFSSTRIVVAPLITFLGFLCMIPAILWKGKGKRSDDVPPPLDVTDDAGSTGNIIVNRK